MGRKGKLIVWAWIGSVAVGPLLYSVQRTTFNHDLACVMVISMSIMLGVINTYIVISARNRVSTLVWSG